MANAQKKRRRFFGWSTLLILILLLGILFALLWLYINKAVTDSSPIPLPKVSLTESQQRQTQQRVDAFRDAVQSHQSVQPLALTSDEVNALIATDSDCEPFKNH